MLRPCCENVSFYLCILSPPPILLQIHRTKFRLGFLLMICLLNYGGLHSCYVKLPVFTVSGSYSEKVSSLALRPDWWIGQRVNQHISYNTCHWNISIQWEMEGTVERYWYPSRCCSSGATIRGFQPHERDIIAYIYICLFIYLFIFNIYMLRTHWYILNLCFEVTRSTWTTPWWRWQRRPSRASSPSPSGESKRRGVSWRFAAIHETK